MNFCWAAAGIENDPSTNIAAAAMPPCLARFPFLFMLRLPLLGLISLSPPRRLSPVRNRRIDGISQPLHDGIDRRGVGDERWRQQHMIATASIDRAPHR